MGYTLYHHSYRAYGGYYVVVIVVITSIIWVIVVIWWLYVVIVVIVNTPNSTPRTNLPGNFRRRSRSDLQVNHWASTSVQSSREDQSKPTDLCYGNQIWLENLNIQV